MLYHKLITLSISCILRISKLHNNVIFSFTKKDFWCSSIMYLPESIHSVKHLDVKKSNKNIISPALFKYLENIDPTFKEKIIGDYTSLNLKNINPYLISNEISNEFATLIKDDLLENMSHVIELNPGYGLLTRKLLEVHVPFIHLYESHTKFYPELQRLKEIFPNRLDISKADLQSISKMLNLKASPYMSNKPNKYICELFTNVPKKNWEEKSCMQIIGTVINFSFIRHLILSVIFQTGFMMHGRAIFYLALSPIIWNVSNIVLYVVLHFRFLGPKRS